MGYRIEQTDRYLGDGQWEWRAWIDASDGELDAVARVVWRLHPTYASPLVEASNRNDRFAIERTAWGRFQLGADIEFKDGSPARRVRRQLRLWYPDENEAPSKDDATGRGSARVSPDTRSRTTRIFLSYGSEDRRIASAVAGTLQRHGFQVGTPDQIKPGTPWHPALQQMLHESDLIVGIVSSDFASPQVVAELNHAHQAGKPFLALVGPTIDKVFGLDAGLARGIADLSNPGFEDNLVGIVQQTLNENTDEQAPVKETPTIHMRQA